jgi:hypothetical protein
MSFNIFKISEQKNINLKDLRLNYKQVASSFCTNYYSLYDYRFADLAQLYLPESQFTYSDREITGFQNFSTIIKKLEFERFVHQDMNITVQPIGSSNMVISVIGFITINNAVFPSRFMENLIIQRNDNNELHIVSTIFKIID